MATFGIRCHKNIFVILFIFLMAAFCAYNVIGSYGFVILSDEFGYWVYAAKLAGYDWSDIASLGSYYSYGYSALLFPIFVLCKNGIWAYRFAIGLNFLMLMAIFFMLKSLADKLFTGVTKDTLALLTIIAVIYPPLLIYSKTTMAESTLAFMYVVICALLYKYFENNRWQTLILLVAANIYIYFVHMRTVGVLISGMLVIAMYSFAKNKNHFWILVIVSAVLLLIGISIKTWIGGHIYAAADKEVFDGNNYAGQIGKLEYIFTPEGFKDFIISIAGKVLYLGAASFGMAYWGFAYVIRQIFRKEAFGKADKKYYLYLFIGLSAVAETLICSIATVRPWRVDGLVYGRYHEFLMPVLMLIGIYAAWTSRKIIIVTLTIIASELPMLCLIIYSLIKNNLTGFQNCMMIGMSYASGGNPFDPKTFYFRAYLLGAALTLTAAAIIICARRNKNMSFLLAAVILIEMALSVRANNVCISSSELGAFRDMRIAERIEAICQENERRIIYIDDGESVTICILQFMMRDKDIIICQKEDELRPDDIVLLDYKNSYADELEDDYEQTFTYGHFTLCYNTLQNKFGGS